MKSKVLIGVLILFALVLLTSVILVACDQKDMKAHETAIMVDEQGKFEYQNGLIRVYPGETIVWTCKTEKKGPFTVHIGWDSPFKECFFHSKNGEPIKVTVPEDAASGYYTYMIAVLVDGIIYTDDPQLIVKRPDGKG